MTLDLQYQMLVDSVRLVAAEALQIGALPEYVCVEIASTLYDACLLVPQLERAMTTSKGPVSEAQVVAYRRREPSELSHTNSESEREMFFVDVVRRNRVMPASHVMTCHLEQRRSAQIAERLL